MTNFVNKFAESKFMANFELISNIKLNINNV
jgi:hypothetical protein